ncbi:heme biosynthesis protein HemY [Francisella philomiragia]|uniref:heme biosynthesis protein HemY n=1 Tax=Francisella philomiragia TaxID=28110 RepID=UPI001C9DC5D7|nr:heme biosynthesis protein HemY [Francisella philomiragia]MBY7735299.1 heme biosynthesis protein HemY [Francisella philomiragia]
MIRIFKLIIVVVLATLIGIWATKNHGYIMLVMADKAIKVNLVAFVFIVFALLFVLVFGFRVIKLSFQLPYLLFNWFIGLFTVDKQERFTDLLADMVLENNRLTNKLSVSNISKISPRHFKEYVLFKKICMIANSKDIKELDKALKQINNNTIVYKFFEVYKLYLVQKLSEARAKVTLLLEKNDSRFLPNIANLAASIALDDEDDIFALKILEKYDVYLKQDLGEKLIILALRKAKDVDKLSDIYNKADTTNLLSRVYLEQLVDFEEMVLAEKFAKKQLAANNILPEMLKIYVNAFSIPVAKLSEKVLTRTNHDYNNILMLLELAVVKSDNYSFKMAYDYIERHTKELLTITQLERYHHILCKFFIKNGDVVGVDISATQLVYQNN